MNQEKKADACRCRGNGPWAVLLCARHGAVLRPKLTVLEPGDDAATANLGNGWRMPTGEDFQELIDNTSDIWTTRNGVDGRLFTASNGNILFLPAAGCRLESDLHNPDRGFYWSSSLSTNMPRFAQSLDFKSDRIDIINSVYRRVGLPVRAVRPTVQN